jgi:hypothetical protein
MQRKWLNILITVLLVSCTSKDQGKLIFSVMGDVPREASEDLLLQRQIAAHNQYSKSEFILHVGDIKTGSAPCAEEVYQRVAGFLKQIKVPTFIVVGDNEWNDCVDPDQAWIYWHQYSTVLKNPGIMALRFNISRDMKKTSPGRHIMCG